METTAASPDPKDQKAAACTVLVVDDEEVIRELFSQWLAQQGYRCVRASYATQAVAVAAEERPGVALLDLRMPGESGVWLARQLREQNPDIALIMVTGAQSFDAAVEGMRLGVLDYLLKPFSRRDLLAAVERAVRWRESTLRARAERRHLEAEIELRSVQLSDAFNEIRVTSSGALESLLVALNTRNPEALAHARRVARMAGALAAAARLRVPQLTDVERGALLHDIGKLAMPDSLMHKPGPLTDDEIAIIRTHPQIGHDILVTVPFLRPAAQIVLASHEWFDGTGYPRRLVGEQIPVGARITTIADTFDALTHSRVYRDPVSAEQASAELARFAGTQFDPDLVYIWLRLADGVAPDTEALPAPGLQAPVRLVS
jgi:response regulator RpfG family c-di-GMP phosphodiesterase